MNYPADSTFFLNILNKQDKVIVLDNLNQTLVTA